jgi:parallel beta-helix repeat protein
MSRRFLVLSWFALKVGLRRSPKTVSAKAMLLSLVVASCMALSAGQALADQVNCGDTLTRDTRLHRDLNCAGSGLIIGADNVRLDLNGHTVAGADWEESVGIEVASRRGVTVRNGVIRNFQIGIRLTDARHALLRKLTLVDTSFFGILLVNANVNSIQANRVFHTGDDHGIAGILLFQSNHNELSRNVLSRNGDGISLAQSDANIIRRNVSSDSGSGVGLFDGSSRNVIEHNVTNRNSDTGILLDGHADKNRIKDNLASGNAFAGIAVGASDDNQVRHNITNRNPGGGIAVVDNAIGTVVEGNEANHNGAIPPGCVPDCPLLDDGIHVDAPVTVLARNTANNNHDLGIQAVPGVTDGGGNRARGNGNPAQCTNIDCK